MNQQIKMTVESSGLDCWAYNRKGLNRFNRLASVLPSALLLPLPHESWGDLDSNAKMISALGRFRQLENWQQNWIWTKRENNGAVAAVAAMVI